MQKPVRFLTDPSLVTETDIRRFADAAEIRDKSAFRDVLSAFVRERLAGTTRVTNPERKAPSLRAASRWVPSATDLQRGREMQLSMFNRPHNLPLTDFVRLSNKSRQQIYKDIKAGRLLALKMSGTRGQKLPDWQLDSAKLQLTRRVLQGTSGIDGWTLYRVLSEPLESLSGHSPLDSVADRSIDDVVGAVFNALGLH